MDHPDKQPGAGVAHAPGTSASARPGRRLTWLGGARRLGQIVPRSALPLIAMLFGAALPDGARGATAAAPLLLSASVLFGVVSMPSLERNGIRLRSTCTTFAAALALLLVSPAFTALACSLARAVGLLVPEGKWAMIAAAAPVSVGAVITARTLGLGQRQMAGFMIWSNLAVPLILPQLVWAAGITGEVGAASLARRMALNTGLPLLLGLALRTWPRMALPRARFASAQIGLTTLLMLGLLRGIGLSDEIGRDLPRALDEAALALLVVMCGIAAIWLVLRRLPDAVLAGVFRSNTVVWASLANVLPERANLLMGMVVLTSYAAPLLTRLVQRAAGSLRSSTR